MQPSSLQPSRPPVRRGVTARTLAGAIAVLAVGATPLAATATTVERVVSPGGIAAWTVYDPSSPLITMSFSFRGGSAQDPPGKEGIAVMTTNLLDEGAGDMDSRTFQERLQAKAIGIGFGASPDFVSGSMRTLTANRDEAARLLRLALTEPRFDTADLERYRTALLTGLQANTTSPGTLATDRWAPTAFPGHPYVQTTEVTMASVPTFTAADLRAYAGRVLARDTLQAAIVGNIDAAAAGKMLDDVFGGLPATANLKPVPDAVPQGLGQKITIDLDVPQSLIVVLGPGIPLKEPDYMAALLVNHILGGGASSRLFHEVREVRGLAYAASSTLVSYQHANYFMATAGTRSERAAEALDVIQAEIRKLAELGPTEDELAQAKSFLTGSYALNFDTAPGIAGVLLGYQQVGRGIDYIDRRNSLVAAVTTADVKRVARRLLDTPMLTTVVGKPASAAAADGPSGG